MKDSEIYTLKPLYIFNFKHNIIIELSKNYKFKIDLRSSKLYMQAIKFQGIQNF